MKRTLNLQKENNLQKKAIQRIDSKDKKRNKMIIYPMYFLFSNILFGSR